LAGGLLIFKILSEIGQLHRKRKSRVNIKLEVVVNEFYWQDYKIWKWWTECWNYLAGFI